MLDHDHVEGAVVRIRARELEAEESAKDRRIDDRKVDQTQPLAPSLGLDLAAEDLPFLESERRRHGVSQPAEALTKVCPRREAGERDIDPGRRGMDEMP